MSSSSATSAPPPLRLNEEKHLLLYCALELTVSASAEMPHVIPPLGRCLVGLLSPQPEEWNTFDDFVTIVSCERDLVVELNLPDDGTAAVQETGNLIRKGLSIRDDDLMDSVIDVGRVARLCRRFEPQRGGTASSRLGHPLLGAIERDSSSLPVFVSTYYSAPCKIWLGGGDGGGAKSQPFETEPWSSDSGYRTNLAFCGPRGYEFIVRATWYGGILRFWPSADALLETSDEEESSIDCNVCEHISAVVSHPLRNNECLTIGVTSASPKRLFLFFYGFFPNDSSSTAKPRQLIAPVNLTATSGNGFVNCLCACHDDQRTLAVFQSGGVLELFSGIPELQTTSWRYEADLGDSKSTFFPQERVFSTGITKIIDLVPMKNKDLIAIASRGGGMYAMEVYNITERCKVYGVEFPGSNPPRCLCTMPREDWERLCERLEE